jgi:hypothetical protein
MSQENVEAVRPPSPRSTGQVSKRLSNTSVSYVWTMRDGKAARVQVYFTWDAAWAQVGLSE